MSKLEEVVQELSQEERDKLLDDALRTNDRTLLRLSVLLGARDDRLMAEAVKLAVREEDVELARFLVENEANVSERNKNCLLKKACELSNLSMVNFLLSIGADASYEEAMDKAYNGEIIKALVENGANPINLFIYVANKGDDELANFCIEEFKKSIPEMGKVVVRACIMKNEPFAIALIENGACDENTLYSAFVNSSSSGCESVVKKILGMIEVPEQYLNHSLQLAAENGNLKIVNLLLNAGANPQWDDSFALKRAIAKGKLETVKRLIEAGADWRADRYRAIRLAADGTYDEVFDFLMKIVDNCG